MVSFSCEVSLQSTKEKENKSFAIDPAQRPDANHTLFLTRIVVMFSQRRSSMRIEINVEALPLHAWIVWSIFVEPIIGLILYVSS